MLISLSKELKERNLNNPGLRKILLEKLKYYRRTPKSNWKTKRVLRHFIWGFDWAKRFPEMLEGNKLTRKQLQENEDEAQGERCATEPEAWAGGFARNN